MCRMYIKLFLFVLSVNLIVLFFIIVNIKWSFISDKKEVIIVED